MARSMHSVLTLSLFASIANNLSTLFDCEKRQEFRFDAHFGKETSLDEFHCKLFPPSMQYSNCFSSVLDLIHISTMMIRKRPRKTSHLV